MKRTCVVFLVIGLLLAGCGGEAGEETTVPPTTVAPTTTSTPSSTTTTVAVSTTVVAPSVEVVRDLVYHSANGFGAPLDVYAPTGVEGGPVVVLFHGGGVTRSWGPYPLLGRAMAGLGAVVFVPDWQTAGGELPADPNKARDALFVLMDGASCAVSYALAHAADYGADPERLVLFGHSAGAMTASVVGLREAVPFPECAVEMTSFVADGMVLWEGDWLLSTPDVWDRYGESLPLLMEAIVPWAWLAAGPRMPVDLVTTAGGRDELKGCGMSDPDSPYWLRDPDGWFRERLEVIGALEDGCIDVGEPAELLAATMREQGYDAAEIFLEHSTHISLSVEDRAFLASEVIAITDR